MPTFATAEVVLPYTTGLPRDVSVNTFAFAFAADDVDIPAAFEDALVSFYNDDTPIDEGAICNAISRVVDRTTNVCKINWFSRPTWAPSATATPIHQTSWTLGPASLAMNLDLPLEVAVCSSYRNETEVTEPVGRRRGRIYIGPLGDNVLDNSGVFPTVAESTVDVIAEATARLAGERVTSGGDFVSGWGIWSRANSSFFGIESGWVDNEFDTQRRRQVDADDRTNWSLLI